MKINLYTVHIKLKLRTTEKNVETENFITHQYQYLNNAVMV